MAVQSAAERAWVSINRFYSNCKAKTSGKKGYPRFQKDNRSIEYKTSGWKLHATKRQITFTDKNGIGKVKLLGKWDIHTFELKQIKRVRLVRRADGYYCQFAISVESREEIASTNKATGLDVGLEFFYTDAQGNQVDNPRFLKKSEKIVKHFQRRIYSKKKGSNKRVKARKRYSRKHLRISRQRIEHAKRLARNLCTSNDVVVYENLQVKNLVKNHCLALAINDVSWYLFRVWLEYFATKFGKVAVAVPPHYTSTECSQCGAIVKKSLSTRTHTCKCGCQLNRDHNAAINILNKGLEQLREGVPEVTLRESLPLSVLEQSCVGKSRR
jgi:putative transposase